MSDDVVLKRLIVEGLQQGVFGLARSERIGDLPEKFESLIGEVLVKQGVESCCIEDV